MFVRPWVEQLNTATEIQFHQSRTMSIQTVRRLLFLLLLLLITVSAAAAIAAFVAGVAANVAMPVAMATVVWPIKARKHTVFIAVE